MRQLASISLLANLCALAVAHGGASFPATLEVDLIFPRMNETYPRVYPFPVVFAIQGALAAWPHEFSFSWDVFDSDRTSHVSGMLPDFSKDGNDSSSSTAEPWTKGDLPEGNDPLYVIAGIDLFALSSSANFSMTWSALFRRNCTADGVETATGGTKPDIIGSVQWTISDDAPELSIVPVDKSCPRPEDTMTRTDNTLGLAGAAEGDPTCIVLDDANLRPKPDPCAVRASPELASRVTQSMLATSRCTGVSWPDDKVVGRCEINSSDDDDDDSGSSKPGPAVAAIAIGVFSFLVGFASLAVSSGAF